MLSDAHNVVSALSFLFDLLFKLNVISLHKNVAEASILHIALMEKNIFTVCRRYKTKTLNRIKKFHDTLRHKPSFLSK